MLTNPYQQYQNNAVLTASAAELTFMLYNGAIKFINKGIDAINSNNNQAAHNSIMRAQEIIRELRATLDIKYDIAKQMDKMYMYISECLVQGNITKDISKLELAKEFMCEFRDTWKIIMMKK